MWPREGVSKADVGVPGSVDPMRKIILFACGPRPFFSREIRDRFHCTVRFTVAVLLAIFGSVVSVMVAAFSVITVPAGAVTFTVNRTVHVGEIEINFRFSSRS